MLYDRLLNKQTKPTELEILEFIGNKSEYWIEIHKFINLNYNFNKELAFFSKNYGWTVRYRKSKKTLVSCFPENEAFSVLLVLGKDEANKVELYREELNENFLSVFDETEQLRDGRWLWIRIHNKQDLDSIIEVIKIKRKPKKQEITRHNNV